MLKFNVYSDSKAARELMSCRGRKFATLHFAPTQRRSYEWIGLLKVVYESREYKSTFNINNS